MKHLFIVNPVAGKVKGEVDAITEEIKTFFKSNPNIPYDIHVTRWCRDAVGFTRRYVTESSELCRVHVVGGVGTLFEVVGGVIGLQNAQVASYPRGKGNAFLRYFGTQNLHYFSSVRAQVFSDTTPVDVIRCGHNYAIGFSGIGVGSRANELGDELMQKTRLTSNNFYSGSVVYHVMKGEHAFQRYKVTLDGQNFDGDYASILIANEPCYGINMHPAVDAHPNDGILDIYLFKAKPKLKTILGLRTYITGHYRKIPDCVSHYTARKVSVSSDVTMCMSMDGETFYDKGVDYEIIPYAIDFVCPNGIDIKKLPRIYNSPEEGLRCDE